MELDDFKARWQKKNEQTSPLNEKNMEQIQGILREKTSGVLANVKKKYESIISIVLISLLGNLLLSPFLPWLLGVDGPIFSLPTELGRVLSLLVVLSLGIAIVFFYWLKYTSVSTTLTSHDMKTILAENIKKLEKSMRHEIYFCLGAFITLFVVARSQSQWMGYGDFWDIFRTGILVALLAAISLIGYYLFYKIKQYQQHIRELKQYLAEFDESNAEATDVSNQ